MLSIGSLVSLFASHFKSLAVVLTAGLMVSVSIHSSLEPDSFHIVGPVHSCSAVCRGRLCSRCFKAQEWASEPEGRMSHGDTTAAHTAWRVGICPGGGGRWQREN